MPTTARFCSNRTRRRRHVEHSQKVCLECLCGVCFFSYVFNNFCLPFSLYNIIYTIHNARVRSRKTSVYRNSRHMWTVFRACGLVCWLLVLCALSLSLRRALSHSRCPDDCASRRRQTDDPNPIMLKASHTCKCKTPAGVRRRLDCITHNTHASTILRLVYSLCVELQNHEAYMFRMRSLQRRRRWCFSLCTRTRRARNRQKDDDACGHKHSVSLITRE